MSKCLTDFEYLYMMRQQCNCALDEMLKKYEAMLWKLSHIQFQIQKPDGVQVNDIYQEAKLGLLEALYTYRESRTVGLAHYVKICVESYVRTVMRKCNTKSYMLLDTKLSLDMSISEDESLSFMDIVRCENMEYDPHFQAKISEFKQILKKRLDALNPLEKKIYSLWNRGYSYEEIASLTSVNTKKIDNIIQKIKRIALRS